MKNKILDNIKTVGFDLDGTLYKSTKEMDLWIRSRLYGVVAEKMGWEVEKAEEEYEKRLAEVGSNTTTLGEYGLNGKEVFAQLWEEFPLGEFSREDKTLIDGLQKLRKKYPIFLLSNGGEKQILKKLGYLGIDPEWFHPFVACYAHEGWTKPNPGGFLHVLEQLELKPEEVLYVGDRVSTDIEGASAVGMRTMMVYGESSKADVSVRTIEEGIEMLLA
jgi:putative hydrolase of the HAD superfamily